MTHAVQSNSMGLAEGDKGDKGRCAIVTGGSEGIGLATSRALAANGAYVFMLGRDAAKMQTAIAETDPAIADRLVPFIGDVTDASTRQALVAATVERFGGPDILVNNAGGGSENRFLEDIDQDDFHRVMALNLDSSFDLCRLVVPFMKARNFGRIINVSSVAGRDAGRLSGPQYAAAKAGMIGMSRHLSRDLGPFGITVNSVAPGFVMTDRAYRKWEKRSDKERAAMLDGVPAGRFGTPEEIAAAVLYFASELSGYTNGACLDVNGGSFRA